MINLLPPDEREKVYSELFRRQISVFGMFLALIFFGSAVFILNTYVFLKIQSRELKHSLSLEEIKSETKEVKVLEDEIENLNVKLLSYEKFKTEKVFVLDVFSKIEDMIPSGVHLNSLTFDENANKIILSGISESRDDVIEMENRIKNSGFFENLESPLSNFLDKSGSKFTFTFYIKK
jgi:Tfp pilus assembly protein PilN